MKPENLPKLTWSLRVSAPKHSTQAVCIFSTLDRNGQEIRLRSWEWPGGRPGPGDLQDMLAAVMGDIESTIVTFIGVQGEMV